jgi:hypothetical protein
MGGPAERPCIDCGETLPHTDDHFKRKKNGLLDTRCLQCRRQAMLGKRKKDRAAALQDIEKGAVSEFTKSAIRGGQTIPHSCEVLERLMEYFGGTSGFTALLVKQYFDSPPGGSARTKILESILRLVTKNTEAGGAKKPLGQWSDEELESELDTRLQVLAVQIQGRIIDGTLAEETEGPATAAVGIEDRRVRRVAAEGAAGRTRRKKDRGPKALPADPEAG